MLRFRLQLRAVLVAACVMHVFAAEEEEEVLFGVSGHRMVAQIALSFLSPSAQKAVDLQLAPGVTLEDLSTLPDEYRPFYPESGTWHYVNMDAGADNVTVSPACDGGCVITAIMNFTVQLTVNRHDISENSCHDSVEFFPCALSWLTHFIGDIHQPMHTGFSSDRGGNDFFVNFFGVGTNIHSVWDTKILERYLEINGRTWSEEADEMVLYLKEHPDEFNSIAAELCPIVWANSSFAVVRQYPYNLFPGTVFPASIAAEEECGPFLGEDYYERSVPIVLQHIAAAGVRLATYLNNIYEDEGLGGNSYSSDDSFPYCVGFANA